MTDPQRMAHLDAAHLDQTLARLDDLIGRTEDLERLRSGLGMRLALTMAKELRDGKALGAESSALVAGWVERHGQDSVDVAVGIAREFLTQPDRLMKEFASRLPTPDAPADDPQSPDASDTSDTSEKQ